MNPLIDSETVSQILSNVEMLIYSRDHAKKYLYIGQQCENFTGYKTLVFTENHELWDENIHKDDKTEYCQKWNALRTGGKVTMEYRFMCKDGTVKWFKDMAVPVLDSQGNLLRIDGAIQDISAQRAVEKELMLIHKEKYLRYIMASIAELNKMIGTAKNPADLFRSMCQKLIDVRPYQYVWIGLLDHECLYKEYTMGKETIEPEIKRKYVQDIQKKIKNMVKTKKTVRGKNKQLGHWVIIPILHHLQQRSIYGYLMIYTHQDDGFLDEEVAMLHELTLTISSALEYQKVDQLMFYQARQVAMGELIGHMAHQWRQPINEVGLILQDLRDAFLCNELNERYIVNSTQDGMEVLQRMSGTIDDFRKFFVGSHKKGSFRIAAVIQQSIDLVKPHFDKLNITIKMVEEHPVTMTGYPQEFAQVVLNLLNNARDAFLRQKTEHSFIVIHINQRKKTAVISFEDNGGGIPGHAMEYIFDQYYSTKDNHQGAGLGLYISKMIIENGMKGIISANNTVDGVKFTVEVPIDE